MSAFKDILAKIREPRPNRVMVILGICVLILLLIFILASQETFEIDSRAAIGISMLITHVIVYSITLIFSALFKWSMSSWFSKANFANDDEKNAFKKIAENSQETGIITAYKRSSLFKSLLKCKFSWKNLFGIIGIIAALTEMLAIGLGFAIGLEFAITTNTIPTKSISMIDHKFNQDPLTPCDPKENIPCTLQNKFRLLWVQEAADIMLNGISDRLSRNWGDENSGRLIIMVAAADNNADVVYKTVKATKGSTIPVFGITTQCGESVDSCSTNYRTINITGQKNLTDLLKTDPDLENRWIAEVTKLEQDDIDETTKITVNFVKILNSKYKGDNCTPTATGNYQLCYPNNSMNITCSTSIRVKKVKEVNAVCHNDGDAACGTQGYNTEACNNKSNYSRPKPIYDYYIHRSLAMYGGHLLMPQCADNNHNKGCLDNETDLNHADKVQQKFVELLRGIIASGVMVRRHLLSGNGSYAPYDVYVEKDLDITFVKITFEEGYLITVLVMLTLCCIGLLIWSFWSWKSDYSYDEKQLVDRPHIDNNDPPA
ncbi:hypothetical protein F8M41_000351 [Gigaspora margarita]|uniref:Uncharacterized protein n=1 Tax=Gigaspora margarita TaxID=4874 RepID=A0A8H4ESZ1_GIGMA|nr:hypothetical protein F8M41_000351 [Gigaspora margarita]